jgi:hypothetical protein
MISTAFHQRPPLDQNREYYKCCAILQKEWEEFAKKKKRAGMEMKKRNPY